MESKMFFSFDFGIFWPKCNAPDLVSPSRNRDAAADATAGNFAAVVDLLLEFCERPTSSRPSQKVATVLSMAVAEYGSVLAATVCQIKGRRVICGCGAHHGGAVVLACQAKEV